MITVLAASFQDSMREVFQNYRNAVNEMIYEILDKKQIPYPKGYNFFGLMEALIRRTKMQEADVADAIQEIIMRVLMRGKGGKPGNIFDYYDMAVPKERYPDDDKQQQEQRLVSWWNMAVQGRVINIIKQVNKRNKRERPTDMQPGDKEKDEPGHLTLDQVEDTGHLKEDEEKRFEELRKDISQFSAEFLKERNQEGIAPVVDQIFNMMLHPELIPDFNPHQEGPNKNESIFAAIARAMNFSKSRLAYYKNIIKEMVKEYIILHGNDTFAELLAKALREQK